MAPANNALAPGTTVAGLVIEPSGTVTWQWVTFFIFGNLFAGFWLVLAFLNAHPEISYKINQLLVKWGLAKPNSSKHARRKLQHSAHDKQQQQDHMSTNAAAANGDTAYDHAGNATLPARPSMLNHLTSMPPRDSASPMRQQQLSSPLKSHRSRPAPPPELCLEQTVTPRTSVLPLSPPDLLGPRASGLAATVSMARAGGPDVLHTPHEADEDTLHAADSGDGEVQLEDDESSGYTDSDAFDSPTLVRLEWRNLCYAVKSADGLRLIVQGIYGCANPQELQGLMGPSGAGKSTLMDLLSKRTDPTGSAAAEVALQEQQQHSLAQRLKALGSHRPSSGDGSAGSPHAVAAADTAISPSHRHAAVSAAGLQSTIQPGQTLPVLESLLLVNGAPLSRSAFMNISAYVPQHDNLVPTMTTLEAVTFYADIILPANTSAKTKRARISRVLAVMGLAHVKDTLVGGTLPGGILLRGLSGGERKRLAIACGVVAGPSLVFLDEPTSGLDSFAALNVVLFLKSMATQGGATLIASLHQPRSAIWGQLDQVTLLASGRLMYTGPTDGLTCWFTSLGYDYSPSTHGMASDWALDLVSITFSKPQQGAAPQPQEAQQAAGLNGGVVGSVGLSSMRQRSLAPTASKPLHGMGSMRYVQAPPAASRPCMMTSKQELNEAASAFLQNLRVQHPHWFVVPEDAPWLKGSRAGQEGLSAIKVQSESSSTAEGASPGAPAGFVASARSKLEALGDDTASSPFLQQDSLGVQVQAGQQAGQLELTAPAVLESKQDRDRGLWASLYGSWCKYTALLWRESLMATRNPADMGGRMMTFTYVALLSGLVAWNTPGDADSIMSRVSSAYAVLSFYLLMPFVFMSLFTSDKKFFAADTTARLYHPFQYYMAKMTVTLPFNVIISIVFHLVYYGMVGMRHGAKAMGQSCFISVLMGLTAMQAVYCCAIVASSQDLAFVYAIAWTALNLLVNPYMANFNLYSLGWGFSWLRFFSPYNFAWQALVKIELAGRGFDCNTSSGLRVLGMIPDLMPQGPQFTQVRNTINSLGNFSGGRCVASGDAVVAMYTTGLSFGAVVGILLGYFMLFMAVTYWVVYRSSKKRGPTV